MENIYLIYFTTKNQKFTVEFSGSATIKDLDYMLRNFQNDYSDVHISKIQKKGE